MDENRVYFLINRVSLGCCSNYKAFQVLIILIDPLSEVIPLYVKEYSEFKPLTVCFSHITFLCENYPYFNMKIIHYLDLWDINILIWN